MMKFKKHNILITSALMLICLFSCRESRPNKSENKATVEKYMAGFNVSDHAKILSCLTDDVVWELPGVYQHEGKAAFDKEIENDAFKGRPVIKINRMTEENNVVIAEGTVLATKKDGSKLSLVFCDVFEMKDGLIKKLTSYLMPKQ